MVESRILSIAEDEIELVTCPKCNNEFELQYEEEEECPWYYIFFTALALFGAILFLIFCFDFATDYRDRSLTMYARDVFVTVAHFFRRLTS